MSTQSGPELADMFLELGDVLKADYTIVDAMDQLVHACIAHTAAVAASILLSDSEGQLHLAASSSRRVAEVDRAQLATRQGPCLQAIFSAKPLEVPDVSATRGLWPAFADLAVAHDFHSVYAIPLRLRGRSLGALGLFFGDRGAVADSDSAIALALSQIAIIHVVQAETLTKQGIVTAELQHALETRAIIDRAIEAIAARSGLDYDEASELLRSQARNAHINLSTEAQRVLAGNASLSV